MKVFKIDGCNCVCARDKKEALKFYRKEFADDFCEDDLIECSLKEKMWYPASIDFLDDYLSKNKVVKIEKDKTCCEQFAIFVTFREVIKFDNITEPCIISSTEF